MSSKNHHQRCASCYHKLAGRGTSLIFFLSIGGDARCSVVNAGFGQSHAREKRGSKKCTAMRSAGSSRGRELAHGDGLAGKDRADANPGPDLHVLLIPHSLFIIITRHLFHWPLHYQLDLTVQSPKWPHPVWSPLLLGGGLQSPHNLSPDHTSTSRHCTPLACSQEPASRRDVPSAVTHLLPSLLVSEEQSLVLQESDKRHPPPRRISTLLRLNGNPTRSMCALWVVDQQDCVPPSS
jgi:hypothetical protein